jgi:hypothetical protein
MIKDVKANPNKYYGKQASVSSDPTGADPNAPKREEVKPLEELKSAVPMTRLNAQERINSHE